MKRVDQAEIHRKVVSSDVEERKDAAEQLCSNFSTLPDKEEAWEDLHRLTWDRYSYVQWRAVRAFGTVFQHIPDKEKAWDDLHRLAGTGSGNVQWRAALAIGSVFQHIPDKEEAWGDLHRLTGHVDWYVRRSVAYAIGSAFQHIPDKEEAWGDLHRLTRDVDWYVRMGAVYAIGSAFQHIPDKEEAWKVLHRLTGDGNSYVRWRVAVAIGSAFQYAPYKEEAWGDLHRLTKDNHSYVQASANHSLGRVYLSNATDAESVEDFKNELENALGFFEKSLKEATYSNPSSFCLLFYRSFHTILFRKAGAEVEVQKYRVKAKDVLGGSRNKETLLEVVKNLENALTEIQKAKEATIFTLRQHLNNYREYCDRAADLICDAPEGTARVLRRGMPIINDVNKEILREFDETSKQIYGTSPEAPRTQTVHISETEQEIVRIAVAQISFELTESFPFVVTNRDEVKTKIFSALEIARKGDANIVCLPELCLCKEWISEIKGKYPDMIVIGGSFYKDNKNICPIIMESETDIPYQPKITPSPFEDGIMGPRMIPGDRIYRYETRFGKFVILICMDFDDLAHFFREADIDMIFCPSFNSANERFQNEA
ncbi:MAG: hypothetical protein U9Q68_08755, partial [Euryarchaeota archaeon]|nr:hypothetical protein [Euryarchaeota archaeon]